MLLLWSQQKTSNASMPADAYGDGSTAACTVGSGIAAASSVSCRQCTCRSDIPKALFMLLLLCLHTAAEVRRSEHRGLQLSLLCQRAEQ